jgi:hypothetical protein
MLRRLSSTFPRFVKFRLSKGRTAFEKKILRNSEKDLDKRTRMDYSLARPAAVNPSPQNAKLSMCF